MSKNLDFTAATWNTGQTITVSAVEDADMGSEMMTLTHQTVNANIVAEYDNAANATLTVNVDDENLGMTVFPQAATMREGSAYTVALHTQPSGPVTVTSGSTAVAINTDGTLQTRVLTYTVQLTSPASGPVTVSVMDNDAPGLVMGTALETPGAG